MVVQSTNHKIQFEMNQLHLSFNSMLPLAEEHKLGKPHLRNRVIGHKEHHRILQPSSVHHSTQPQPSRNGSYA
uniref:Uncharacterized protein n=1 Tax=Solanum tuberosum TaxID=4113 RepID=M1CAN6_SOLTU